MSRRLVIVPRWSGHSGSDFYPWLTRALASEPGRPYDPVVALDLPEPGLPRLDTWPPAIYAALGEDLHDLGATVVLAHSVGCQATLHALAALPRGARISAMVAVAGWWEVDEPWPAIVPWQTSLPDLERVRAAVGKLVVLLSDDDPFTRNHTANAALWRNRLDAEVVLIPGAGHFNNAGAPEVLETLRTL